MGPELIASEFPDITAGDGGGDEVGEVEELMLGTTVLQAELEELHQLGLRVWSEGLFHRKAKG
jgi:hypothetical protein